MYLIRTREYVAVVTIGGPLQDADHIKLVVRAGLVTDDGPRRSHLMERWLFQFFASIKGV